MKRALLALILTLPSFASADGTLYVSPAHATYSTGETFQVRVLADTGGQFINAAESELDFDPRALSVQSISTVGSILSSWSTQPTYSNSDGTVEFSGWADKRYSGSNGLLITITFKALQSMSGNARFAAGAILAADGQGSNIISDMKSATYTIRGSAPQRSSQTTPSPVQSPVSSNESYVPQPPTTREGVDIAPQVQPVHGIVKPDSPSLSEYPRSIAVGEHIYMKGTADADTPVRVFLQYGDTNSPKNEQLMTSADGSFTYASDELDRPGIYYLWAQEERGSEQSDPSRTIKIEVIASSATASVQEAAALLEESIPILVILAFFGLFIAYSIHRRTVTSITDRHHIV